MLDEGDKHKQSEFLEVIPSGLVMVYLVSFGDDANLRTIIYHKWPSIFERLGRISPPLLRIFSAAFDSKSDVDLFAEMDGFFSQAAVRFCASCSSQRRPSARNAIRANKAWVDRDYEVVKNVLAAPSRLAPTESSPYKTPRGRADSVAEEKSRNGGGVLLKISESLLIIGLVVGAGYGLYLAGKKVFHVITDGD